MKVCAHISLGPWSRSHERFSSVKEAVDYFTSHVAGQDYGTGTDEQAMDLYPQCDECNSTMNFHDYPMARYDIGPRGGVRHVSI